MPFDLQPVLRGKLLSLRPLRPDDFADLYAVAADPLIWQQHPASNRHEESVFQRFFSEALESGGALLATDAKDGKAIGSSRFHGFDEKAGEVEIGWTFLARSYWGGGYNKEMKRLMLKHACRYVDRVLFVVGAGNVRSQRAIEKIGAARIGTRLGADCQENIVYEIRPSTSLLNSR